MASPSSNLKRLLAMGTFYGRSWGKTGAVYGATGLAAFLYLSDWKVIVTKIPFYGGQFKEEE